MRPWSPIPIEECHEPLVDLPDGLLRLEPHPYVSLGAPYGEGASPFRLRQGVLDRLWQAQAYLQSQKPNWRLAIFDAWRPVAVQAFMVAHATTSECQLQGVDPHRDSPERQAVIASVARFWAPPSADPATPPPHSTGSAVDLTLAGPGDEPLPMGGEIDAIGAISEPDHYAQLARDEPQGEAATWHHRRLLLAAAMASAGFAQHPHEWWHFSWGDQLWAWRTGQPLARYGSAS